MKILKLLMSVAMYAFVATASGAFAQAATVSDLTGVVTAGVAPTPGVAPLQGRTLKKGDTVNQGETLSTGANSSVVLLFKDGQIASLSGNSRSRGAPASTRRSIW